MYIYVYKLVKLIILLSSIITDCGWLPLAASGRGWLRLAAAGCSWLQPAGWVNNNNNNNNNNNKHNNINGWLAGELAGWPAAFRYFCLMYVLAC